MRRTVTCFIIILVVAFPVKGFSINLSPDAEISVLSCGPGKEIHALYGHTGIRVKDPLRNLDTVFNYGIFSFDEPNFAYRFAKGLTFYMVGAERFDRFCEEYRRSGRSISEQVLDISPSDKQRMWGFLVENARPENRKYLYNFLHDNCATRVRDVVESQVEGQVVFPDQGQNKTFRQHVDHYQKVLPWVNFGIHLTLGSPTDLVATAYQEMFLPDFLMKHFGEAVVQTRDGTHPLVKETRIIYEPEKKQKTANLFPPVPVLSVLLLVVVAISIRQFRNNKVKYWPDYILLFFTGFIGLVLLWFVIFSEHPAMHPNFDLLWAVPANFLFGFVWMKKRWRSRSKWYWPALTVWLVLFLLFQFIIPQSFYPGFYLIILMILCRAVLHSACLLKL